MRLSSILHRRPSGNVPFRQRKGDIELAVDAPLSRKAVILRRRRRALTGMRWIAVLSAVTVLCSYTAALWEREFLSNPAYAVGSFEFSTNGVISPRQVAEVTGLRPDHNVTHVPLEEVRAKLLALPRVKSAEVRRRLPNHLSIRLEERRPAAWLACARNGLRPHDSRGLLLDADGVAFQCEMVLNEYTMLPVIHMADLAAVTPGRRVEQLNVLRALELVARMQEHRWPLPMRLEQVHVTNRFTLMAQMDTDAIFTFRPDRLPLQLARLDAILRRTQDAQRLVTSVNLQLERNIPVTFSQEDFQKIAPERGQRQLPQAQQNPRARLRQEAPVARSRSTSGAAPASGSSSFRTDVAGGEHPAAAPSPAREEEDIRTILQEMPEPPPSVN